MRRYKTDADPYGYDEHEHGKWVRYEDVTELVEMLKELEFIQCETDESNYEYCPICEALSFAGHLTTCRLAALLKREGGE